MQLFQFHLLEFFFYGFTYTEYSKLFKNYLIRVVCCSPRYINIFQHKIPTLHFIYINYTTMFIEKCMNFLRAMLFTACHNINEH